MRKIKIDLTGNSYNVLIDSDLKKELNLFLQKNFYNSVLFAIDRNVYKYHKRKIDILLTNPIKTNKKIIITTTEKNKSYTTLQKIHSVLIKNKFGRDSLIVTVGGGIVGDIAGFVAATYMRGIDYIQIPTTLLAIVDSSVGGKTGINFGETKNIIGAFHQPKAVIVDFSFLKTLPEQEILCGLGEIVKYSFLASNTFFYYLMRNFNSVIRKDKRKLNYLIYNSIEYKARVVESDEKENGLRKVLNLGHTFAHAFEIERNHVIKHGLAVIWGITTSLFLSFRLGILSGNNLEKYLRLMRNFKKDIDTKNVDVKKIYDVMQHDKKNREGKLKFVLLKSIGNILLDVEADKNVVYLSINDANRFFNF